MEKMKLNELKARAEKKEIIFIGSPFQGIAKAALKNNVRLTRKRLYIEAEKLALILVDYVRAAYPNAVPFSPILAFGKIFKEGSTTAKGRAERETAMESCIAMLLKSDKYLYPETPFTEYAQGMRTEEYIAHKAGIPLVVVNVADVETAYV